MLFNSVQFLIFYPIVLIIYFILPSIKTRNILLLLSSYYFYSLYKFEYTLLIAFSTIVDYFAGLYMNRIEDKKKRQILLITSLSVNLGTLFFFKYFNFFNDNLNVLFSHIGLSYATPNFDILLPVGISFYTFQTLSYTIDVYRGKLEAEKDFITFALYVTFFPQLVAGPIERATNLLGQFREYHKPSYQRVVSGIRLMMWGFFKKVVIADRVAVVVDSVYNSPDEFTGIYFIITTVLFAFQIFCDFSGYSDIAIGSARIMGYDLMKNFDRPYHSKSVTEFWRRWHISLSTWFLDYLYIPLGGNRKGRLRTYINLFTIFLVSGLWHGASWTFVIWGILNGVAVVIERLICIDKFWVYIESEKKLLNIIVTPLGNILTFIYICITWIFFRANSVSDAVNIIIPKIIESLKQFDLNTLQIFSFSKVFDKILATKKILGLENIDLLVALIAIIVLELVHIIQRRGSITKLLYTMPAIMRHTIYVALTTTVIWLAWTGNQQFIYFAF